jgi:hypothetical protein
MEIIAENIDFKRTTFDVTEKVRPNA